MQGIKMDADDDDGKKVNYFSVTRTQPFLVSFFHSIVCFRRLAKAMSRKSLFEKLMAVSKINKLSSLRKVINIANKSVKHAKDGQDTIIDTSIQVVTNNKKKAYDYWNDATVVAHFERKKNRNTVKLIKKSNHKGDITLLAARQILNYHKNVVHHTGLSKIDMFTKKLDNELMTNSSDIGTNAVVEKKKTVEAYLPGTSLYFGAAISLQARHGGFLSYFDPENIRASAHKILPTAKFILLKCGDLTNQNVCRFGDPVWFVAGQNDVLGAQYGGGPIIANERRKIHPALINYRKNNIFKAQQYGRWIILNKESPIESIGMTVGHLDKVIFEQEWYFLSSISPYESGMYHTKANIDNARYSTEHLFNPGEECTWRIHLADAPQLDQSGEKKRAKLLSNAQDQVVSSKNSRILNTMKLFVPLKNKLDPTLLEDNLVQKKLSHILEFKTNQQYLVCKYATMSESNFEVIENSPELLKAIYGEHSNIYHFRQQCLLLQQQEHGQLNEIKYHSKLESKYSLFLQQPTRGEYYNTIYWDTAQLLLMDTKVAFEMHQSMGKYYFISHKRKNRAIRIIQRYCRKYLLSNKLNSFRNRMCRVDDKVKVKLTRGKFTYSEDVDGHNDAAMPIHTADRGDRSTVKTDSDYTTDNATTNDDDGGDDTATGSTNSNTLNIHTVTSNNFFLTESNASPTGGISPATHVKPTTAHASLKKQQLLQQIVALPHRVKSTVINYPYPKHFLPVISPVIPATRQRTHSSISEARASMASMRAISTAPSSAVGLYYDQSAYDDNNVNAFNSIDSLSMYNTSSVDASAAMTVPSAKMKYDIARIKLGYSDCCEYGLPHDIFDYSDDADDAGIAAGIPPNGLDVGVRFLRSVTSLKTIHSDLKIKSIRVNDSSSSIGLMRPHSIT